MFIINRGFYLEMLYQVLISWTIEHVEVMTKILRFVVFHDITAMM